MIIFFCVIIALVTLVFILYPFVRYPGGTLASASFESDPQKLKQIKESLVRRYVEEEGVFRAGRLGQRIWQQRSQFLKNKYLDAARRLDFIEHQTPEQGRG